MDTNETSLEALLEKAEDYGKTTIELFKLNAINKSAEVVSSLVVRLVIFMAIVLCLLIINIGIALWLGELLGKSYYGFFILAGFYAILSILLYYFRQQWIGVPVSNSIIDQMLKHKQNEE